MGFTLKIPVWVRGCCACFVLFALFALFAVVDGWRGSGGGGLLPSIVKRSDTTNTEAKKALYLRLYVVGGIIIPLQPIKPFICPQIELHEKKYKDNERRKKEKPRLTAGQIIIFNILI